jgi:hypothetical protein
LPRLGLLDVQGFESKALSGFQEGPLPELLVVEVDPLFMERAGTTVANLYASMEQLGYHLRSLLGESASHDPSRLPERNVVGVLGDADVAWCSRAADAND